MADPDLQLLWLLDALSDKESASGDPAAMKGGCASLIGALAQFRAPKS
jgi:hypothetical protein